MTSNYKMDDDGLRLDSQNVRHNDYKRVHQGIWYYEQKNGLYVVVEYTDMGQLKNKTFIIPRKQILQYAHVAETL